MLVCLLVCLSAICVCLVACLFARPAVCLFEWLCLLLFLGLSPRLCPPLPVCLSPTVTASLWLSCLVVTCLAGWLTLTGCLSVWLYLSWPSRLTRLSVCLYVCVFVCLSVCLSVCRPSVLLSVCPVVCLSVCLFARPSVCLLVRLCLGLSVFLCLSVCLSVSLFVCLSVHCFILPCLVVASLLLSCRVDRQSGGTEEQEHGERGKE